MEIFTQLEQAVSHNNNYLNAKIADVLDLINDNQLMEDLFELQSLV